MKEDMKLLLSVAALVVVGAVGIALVASLTAGPDPEEANRVEPIALPTPAYEVEPARYEVPAPSAVVETPLTLDVEEVPALATPEEFRIEPGEDLVARGLETYRAREFDKAVTYFETEVSERPENGWTQYMLALSLWKSGRLDEAAETMRRSVEIDATSVPTFVNLSRIENERADFEAALSAAQAAIEIDPESASARFLEARSLHNLGRREEALEALRSSLELDADNGYAQNLRGLMLIELGRESEAIEPLERAAELEPDVAFIANNLGMALERSGRKSEALAAYRRAVEVDAEHARALANLARLEPLVPVEPEDTPGDVAEEPLAVASQRTSSVEETLNGADER